MTHTTMYKFFNLSLIITTISLMVACNPKEPVEATLFLEESDVASATADGKIYTINEFLDAFMTEKGNFEHNNLYRTRSVYAPSGMDTLYLFSLDTIPSDGPAIYIRGRITTDDYGGNFYKVLCIQQMVGSEQQALRLSVDAGNANGLYPRGQEILIKCNGLCIGRYANQPQLCVPSYNNNVYAQKAEEKVGWAPGRIPVARFKAATQRIGKPDPNKLVYEEISDVTTYTSRINASDVKEARKLDAKLVRIKNVHFTGEYSNNGTRTACTIYNPATSATVGDPEQDGNTNVFGPTTLNVGYPQSRVIEDANGNPFMVSTSEYAKYAHYYLPSAPGPNMLSFDYSVYSGSIDGIIGFYQDNGTSAVKYGLAWDDWAITPCSMDDIHMADADGNAWAPLEFSKSAFGH